ncbi:MAG: glycine cleavage system protein H [Planctomycetes bacterium]|nr:glycine cleavage system protein H [Planctomycetota bacterium]
MKKPSDLYYSTTHIWIRLEENNEAYLGITDNVLNDWHEITQITLPKKGKEIEYNLPFGEIESTDNVLNLISPINAQVLAVNNNCRKNHGLVLNDPYDDGWLLKIKLADVSELNTLMNSDDYENLVDQEEETMVGEDSYEEY